MDLFIFVKCNISFVFSMVFILLFSERKRSLLISVIISVVSAVLLIFTEVICFEFYFSNMVKVFFSVPQTIIVQGTSLLISRHRDWRALFSGMSAATYTMIGNISGAFFYLMYDNNIVIGITVTVITHIIVLFTMCKLFRYSYLEALHNKNIRWGRFCLIPALFYFCIYTITFYPTSIYETSQNLISAIGVIATMFVTYTLAFRLMQQKQKEVELAHNNEIFEIYTKTLENKINDIYDSEKKIAILRHDMRHYIKMLSALIENNEYEEAKKAIEELDSLVSVKTDLVFCKNKAINAIVGHFVAYGKRLGITIDVKLDIPQELTVNSIELASVFANLIENAINACEDAKDEKSKKIKIYSRRVEKHLIVEISNNCSKNIEIDAESGFPKSKAGKGHGLGMKSVAAFASKYDAIFDFSVEENVFFARLLLDKC